MRDYQDNEKEAIGNLWSKINHIKHVTITINDRLWEEQIEDINYAKNWS